MGGKSWDALIGSPLSDLSCDMNDQKHTMEEGSNKCKGPEAGLSTVKLREKGRPGFLATVMEREGYTIGQRWVGQVL